MELWIRNQDKTRLTKVNDLYLVHDENNACDYIGSNMVGHLAKYTTPGRALEVLDEIQELFTLRIENETLTRADLLIKARMLPVIYQMPKE